MTDFTDLRMVTLTTATIGIFHLVAFEITPNLRNIHGNAFEAVLFSLALGFGVVTKTSFAWPTTYDINRNTSALDPSQENENSSNESFFWSRCHPA